MSLWTPDFVRACLPQVGDRMMKMPTYYYGFGARYAPTKAKPCVVVYVHPEHLWYTVQFEKSGVRESYKLPDVAVGPKGGLLG